MEGKVEKLNYSLNGYEYQAINVDEYILTADMSEEEVIEALDDPLIRICNLYTIINKEGSRVKFRPNWAQCVVLYAIFIDGHKRIAVPKARQIGFSTLFEIILLDAAQFNPDFQCSIVDQTQGDASEKLDKCKVAFEEMPEMLRVWKRPNPDSTKEMGLPSKGKVVAGKNARGGTNQLLHISEWGPIAWEDPKRSTEIITGAMPSVPMSGYVFAESTFKGGKGGDWYNLLLQSLSVPPEMKTVRDFLVLFFPWWIMPEYTVYGDLSRIDHDTMAYLQKTEEVIEQKLTNGQKLFYYLEKQRLGDHIKQEYPSTLEEMWDVKEAGLIFASALDKQRTAGKVNEHVAYYSGLPVYTAWDIGAPKNTKCIIFQVVGDRILCLEGVSGGDDIETPADWADFLRRKPYRYGGHFLPHDGEILWRRLLEDAGLSGVVVCARAAMVWEPIADSLSAFSRCEFNTVGCGGEDGLLASLDYYHSKQEPDEKTIRDVPVHDWSSHYCSSFNTIHQAIRQGLLVDRAAIPAKHNELNVEIAVTGGPRS
jgi:hypothetical protein